MLSILQIPAVNQPLVLARVKHSRHRGSLRTEFIKEGKPIIRFVESSSIPVGVGNMFDSSTSKSLEMIWDNYRYLNGGNNESPSK